MTEPILLNQRYRLQERLGTGGMAVVYRARDLMLERDVAVKLLRENFSPDPNFQQRFRQEAKAAANLSHPNIVTVHDFGYDSGRLYIVMEYLPGTELKSILQHRGRYSIPEAINLLIQACAGVGYAHRAGLVHCDIKPQNFLITPDNRLKVTDFGIARALSTIRPDEKSEVVWGSPQYFSPEQAQGLAPSPASDVYSLGVIFYEMITGKLPFTATNAEELARMHREDPPPPPSRYLPSIQPELELFILKVLSKEPSARYRTADQMGRVLLTISRSRNSNSQVNAYPVSELTPANPTPLSIQVPPEPIKRSASGYPPRTMPASPVSPNSYAYPDDNPLHVDWITIFLGLAALVLVGGLIPFWLWIYFLYQ